MIMEKGLTIHYSPEDLAELYEFIQWKTKKTARSFASVESSFDLKEANSLIKRAQLEKQNILRQIEAERGSQDALAQAREDISLLPDREAEKVRHDWLEQASIQAKNYAQSRNAGASPKSFDPNNKEEADIRSGVLSWIKRTKMRGGLGGRKTLDMN
jgi:hypothetical protein